MTRNKFIIPDFDACSVALFASLVFMGPQLGRSQQQPPTRPALSGPAARDSLRARPSSMAQRLPARCSNAG